jgi:uncharacterized short protein YbdD (DUF466 family)
MSPRRSSKTINRLAAGFSVAVSGLRSFGHKLAQTARLAVGVPDYSRYVEHQRSHHPDQPVMSYKEFFRERQASRYRKGSSRCC